MYNLIAMESTSVKKQVSFDLQRIYGTGLQVCAWVIAVTTLLLTFTCGDYYIFNRIGEYGFFFCLSQWVKKAGVVLILVAVFFHSKSCADAVKFVLPLFILLSCCLFGGFFDCAPVATTPKQEIYNAVNLGFPKWLNVTLFFINNVALAGACGLFIARDGVKVKARPFICLPLAMLAAMPLNLFENFFDITKIPQDSFLRFRNFTLWHFLALCILAGSTVGFYYFLKNKSRQQQDKWLCAVAVTLLLQYHCKDSMLLGDGYNVYNTVFAAMPLFICNAGVYVASASVIFKKRVLYAMSFFIHAVGALTVFVYFGKDEMSNYGIFCSYSILYFCLTHCLLFALCVVPSALGHYRFKIKDCIIPLVYYCVVIILAGLASGLVTEFLSTYEVNGYTLTIGPLSGYEYPEGTVFDMSPPNYAFTQVCPLPIEVPNLLPLGGFMKHVNIFYVFLVYLAYVCLFFAFYGAYSAFLALRKVVLKSLALRGTAKEPVPETADAGSIATETAAETAAAESAAADYDESEPSEELTETEEHAESEKAAETVD